MLNPSLACRIKRAYRYFLVCRVRSFPGNARVRSRTFFKSSKGRTGFFLGKAGYVEDQNTRIRQRHAIFFRDLQIAIRIAPEFPGSWAGHFFPEGVPPARPAE